MFIIIITVVSELLRVLLFMRINILIIRYIPNKILKKQILSGSG